MNYETELSVYTDDIEVVERKSGPGPRARIADVVKVSSETLARSIKTNLGVLARSLAEATKGIAEYSVAEVRLHLKIGASGEVSIISLVEGGANAESGIEVVLRPSDSRKESNS